MNLTRTRFSPEGIFGELTSDNGEHIAYTLEHSYDNQPKLPIGEYVCIRGFHRLIGMTQDFETFEITGVPGHIGILFHVGNYNKDSEGCVLLGTSATDSMILNSREAFSKFMAGLEGVNSFNLLVQ